ncbi:hypothetical protein ACFL6S_16585 [Candidatus Poribacteria bacterium]
MAKKRRQPKKSIRKRSSVAQGDWEHYLFQDFGLSVAYIGQASEDGKVEAALFGMDTWCSGLIVCCGRRFETKEAFEATMQESSRRIKPSTRFRCREEIAYGLRIRLTAEVDLPPQFDQWRHLVDPLDEIKLPRYLYRCPECGRGISEEHAQQALDGVDSRMVPYFLCERCKRSRAGKPTVNYVCTKHAELIEAVEDVEEFSVTWDQDNTPFLTHLPVEPNVDEAVRIAIAEGNLLQAASFAIECHIAYTAVPSDAVEDRHVLEALQAVIRGRLVIDDEDDDLEIVDSLVEVIKEGIETFTGAMRSREQARSRARSALQWVAESVENHHSATDPRSYINFIRKFIPV